MNKDMIKIRSKLNSEKYHLCETEDSWKLFKKYEDFEKYMSKENTPILSSEHNTIDDLKQFVKAHKEYGIFDFWKLTHRIKMILGWLIFIIYIFSNCKELGLVPMFLFLICIFESLIFSTMSDQNFKVKLLEIKEKWKIK